MDIEFFYGILKLTSLSEGQIEAYIKDYAETVNTATMNILFEELKNSNRNELSEKLKTVILEGEELYRTLDFTDNSKKENLSKRFEQILLEINDELLQNKIKEAITKKIADIDKLIIEKVVVNLDEGDKNKILNNLNKILNN